MIIFTRVVQCCSLLHVVNYYSAIADLHTQNSYMVIQWLASI